MSFSWQVLITVFTLGGIGACVRGLIIGILAIPNVFVFPLGVLFINIIAGFLGGFITAMVLPTELHIALVIGFVGGMGTLSAITSDVIDLYYDRVHRRRAILYAVAYLLITSILGTFSAYGGVSLGQMLSEPLNKEVEDQAQRRAELEKMLQSMTFEGEAHHFHGPQSMPEIAPIDDAHDAVGIPNTDGSASTQPQLQLQPQPQP